MSNRAKENIKKRIVKILKDLNMNESKSMMFLVSKSCKESKDIDTGIECLAELVDVID
jgi:hypothetical protein